MQLGQWAAYEADPRRPQQSYCPCGLLATPQTPRIVVEAPRPGYPKTLKRTFAWGVSTRVLHCGHGHGACGGAGVCACRAASISAHGARHVHMGSPPEQHPHAYYGNAPGATLSGLVVKSSDWPPAFARARCVDSEVHYFVCARQSCMAALSRAALLKSFCIIALVMFFLL